MVEYRVQNHAHPAGVQRVDRLFKVLVGTQSAVDGQHVAGVVSMRVRGEDRVEQNGAHAQLAQIGRPVNQVPYSMQRRLFLLCGVIIDGGGVKGAAEHAQRIDLIQGGVECPHKKSP